MNDPYKVLGVSPSASDEEVKTAYRNLAKKYHPDNYANSPLADLADEKMKEINEAYDQILNDRKNGGSTGYAGGGGYAYQQGYTPNSEYMDVRNMIAAGRIADAEQILDGVPPEKRDAEWYFLKGTVLYRRGWLDEARQQFQVACNSDPGNLEYRQAYNLMQQGGQAYRSYNTGLGGMDSMDCCTSLLCLNCLCGGGGCR